MMFSIVLHNELIKSTVKISSLEKQFRATSTAFSQVGVQDSLCNVSFGQYADDPYPVNQSARKNTLCYSFSSQEPALCKSESAKESVLLNSVVVHNSMPCATQSDQKSLCNTKFK